MKNKTLAAWLTFLGGPLGLHRFYLMGWHDLLGWLLPIPTALGLYGIERIRNFGVDDIWSWLLVPLLGFTIAGCALFAILYGLMPSEKWNARFNPELNSNASPGETNWLTIGAIVIALSIGTATLVASFAFSFQHYFEYQATQSASIKKSAN